MKNLIKGFSGKKSVLSYFEEVTMKRIIQFFFICILVFGIAASAHADYQGTIGTRFTINGSGFGYAKSKVYVLNRNKKVQAKIETWTDSSITCLWTSKISSGSYSAFVQPKGRGVYPIGVGNFTIMQPSINQITPNDGVAGNVITVNGWYFTNKKPKVYLQDPNTYKKKSCKIVSSFMDPITGSSSLQFVIPKWGLAKYNLILINAIGQVTAEFPSQCTYSISPSSQSFDSIGGTGSVNVTATSGCSWTATSNASWITITSGDSGSGNGTVNFSVASSSGITQRAGSITVTGNAFTITQEGVSPSVIPVANAGSDQNVGPGSFVRLDGSASYDPQGKAIFYNWAIISKPIGSNAELSSSTTVNPAFTTDLDGAYVIQLVVSNDLVASLPSIVNITSETQGDKFALPGVITVTFPKGSIADPNSVSLAKTTSSEIISNFDETAAIYAPLSTMTYAIYLTIGKNPLSFTDFVVDIDIPEEFLTSVTASSKIQAFALFHYENMDPEVGTEYDYFEIVPSTFDIGKGTLKALLSNNAFSSKRNSERNFEAVLMIGTIKIQETTATKSMAMGEISVPWVTELGKPLQDQLKIVGAYGYEPGHTKEMHGGVDFRAQSLTDVLAVNDGYIERVWTSCTPYVRKKDKIKTYAYSVIIRHNDYSASGYRHLSPYSVVGFSNLPRAICSGYVYKQGDKKYQVNRGDKIAKSGDSGAESAHLHFEYAPFGGIAITGKPLINPIPLMVRELKMTPPDATIFIGDTPQIFGVKAYDETDNEIVRRSSEFSDYNETIPITAIVYAGGYPDILDIVWSSSDYTKTDVSPIGSVTEWIDCTIAGMPVYIMTNNGKNEVFGLNQSDNIMITAKDNYSGLSVTATVNVTNPITYSLSRTIAGNGTGTISADPPCCSYAAGTNVTLMAMPNSGSTFTGWSGSCESFGTNPTCTLTMNGNKSVVANFSIMVPLTITTTSLPDGTTDTPYSYTFSASGGMEPYSWFITFGSLPPGIEMDSSGRISGTPTTGGNYYFDIKVTDSSSSPQSDFRSFSINIIPFLSVSITSASCDQYRAAFDEYGTCVCTVTFTYAGTACGPEGSTTGMAGYWKPISCGSWQIDLYGGSYGGCFRPQNSSSICTSWNGVSDQDYNNGPYNGIYWIGGTLSLGARTRDPQGHEAWASTLVTCPACDCSGL
jgi:hypothetical protein